ncbi:hypothetical protein [uncultured Desulfuromonas sp.]|uniref:hypothetical protein n=1 Tax=uncultured Desulfuromonas sp. TaxID=181013 RepID=UPI002AAAC01F|nr:hypothetical protein [uncultured Desulfuromonas sp.]
MKIKYFILVAAMVLLASISWANTPCPKQMGNCPKMTGECPKVQTQNCANCPKAQTQDCATCPMAKKMNCANPPANCPKAKAAQAAE